jgi:hypothetical protein
MRHKKTWPRNIAQEHHKCSKHKTSRGVPWSKVRVEELPGMVEDGIVAAAVLKAVRDLNKDDFDR